MIGLAARKLNSGTCRTMRAYGRPHLARAADSQAMPLAGDVPVRGLDPHEVFPRPQVKLRLYRDCPTGATNRPAVAAAVCVLLSDV